MAAAIVTHSLSFCLDPNHHHHNHHSYHLHTASHFKPQLLAPKPNKFEHYKFALSFSSSHSSSSSSSSPSSTSSLSSFFGDPLRKGRFLSKDELEKLQFLENFEYSHELKSGSMWVRVMRAEETDATVGLLAESFAESMLLPVGYVSLLRFLVKQYLIERRAFMPHTATLVGFYREEGDRGEGEEFAGTVEVSFDKRGASASPPSPTPPKNSPYICNMTVKNSLRRRGIGWHLLKASEKLVSQMSSSREVYLHCGMNDTGPFDMYKKAGYSIIKTDSILILLMLQRRKHLMCKKLPGLNSPEKDYVDEEISSRVD